MGAGKRRVMRENKGPPSIRIEPFTIDGHFFESVEVAHNYLLQIDGRIHQDRLARYLRQRRRILDGHVLGYVEGAGHCPQRD